MKLTRHCHEKLPGGYKAWARLARLAGYKGPVEVRGYGTDNKNTLERTLVTHTIIRGYSMGFRIGYKEIPYKIVVYLGGEWAPCAKFWPMNDDPLFTFAHELGHMRDMRRGRYVPPSDDKTYAQWHAMKSERRADRYAKRLLRRAGFASTQKADRGSRPLRPVRSLADRPT